jgi:hypothetical protein
MSSQSINPSLYQKAICVSSSKRIEGNSANFTQRISLPHNNTFTKISLVHASIPKGWYMIDSGKQSTITYNDEGGTTTFLFPRVAAYTGRNYTYNELTTELAAGLDEASVATGTATTFTVGLDSAASKFVIQRSNNLTFDIEFQNNNEKDQNVARYFGLYPNSTVNVASGTGQLISPNRINLQRYSKLFLNCSLTSNSDDSILTELYMAGTGNQDVFEYRTPDACMSARGMSGNQNDNIRVSLLDANKRAISLNGLEWDATIVCYDDRACRPRC